MDLTDIGCWKVSENSELFFNEISNQFFVKNKNKIYVYEEGQGWVYRYELGDYALCSFDKACANFDIMVICYQATDSEIVIYI